MKKFSLKERFLKTCNGFCNAKHKLGCDWGQGYEDIKRLFCRSFILRCTLFCACMHCLPCELCSGKTPCDYAQQYPLPLPSWISGNNPLKGTTGDRNISERQESIGQGSSVSFMLSHLHLSSPILAFIWSLWQHAYGATSEAKHWSMPPSSFL